MDRIDQEDAGRLELTVRGTACIALLMLPALLAAAAGAPAVVSVDPGSAYRWQLPPGFPVPAVPADNPMSLHKVELGRRLFREPHLSLTGAYACSSCHQSQRAYTDGRPRALGATGGQTRHSAMSLANVAYDPSLTWDDAGLTTLEAQMHRPLFNQHPIEMGLAGRRAEVLHRLSSDSGYIRQFAEAFAQDCDPVSLTNVVRAIAAYERTLISGRSSFDRYVYDDDQDALSPGAKHGMALFYSARIGCSQCHFGLNFSGPMRFQGSARVAAIYADTGFGRMRVPTLRNVALTAPYMHDGSLATLSDVIDHYASGGRPGLDRRMHAFAITGEEKSDLIAFLQSLTDPDFVAHP